MDIQNLLHRFCALESTLLEGERALQIVSWDRRANTPAAAGADRGHTVGYLSDLQHQLLTSAELRRLLDTLAQPEVLAGLDSAMQARIRLVKRDSDRMAAIPREMYAAFSVLQTQSEAAWEQAKRTNDWPLYRPHLQKMFDYTNRFIDLWGYEGSRYNALIGREEEGMTAEKLDVLFADIRAGIVPLVKAVQSSGADIDDSFCRRGPFPIDAQRRLGDYLLDLIGFRRDWGVLAESEHPYTCTFGPHDVRLTTHYYESEFLPALFSTLHEGGHGLYEQCIAPELHRTRAGCGLAGGMHESVSRFWENMVGRSLPFWQYNLPKLQELFPGQLGDASPEDLYRAVNKCGRSYTRMEADELTYNLHIMLRYELERDVFEGRARVDELPGLWREKMQGYLGLTPPSDTLGILQDIQWSMAQFGYFPTYALGNLYNAQYAAVLRRELDFDTLIRRGEYHVIRDAMREKLYRFGAVRTPAQAMLAMTGEEVSARPLVQYLTEKFSTLYGLKTTAAQG